MKKHIVFFLIVISGFFFSCSTSPYLKKTDLPDNIQHYSEEKQFKVKPEWYWRLRPNNKTGSETFIGQFYFRGEKMNDAKVIGELTTDNVKWYIVDTINHGYFFIKKADADFADKYKKYLIDLDYGSIDVKDKTIDRWQSNELRNNMLKKYISQLRIPLRLIWSVNFFMMPHNTSVWYGRQNGIRQGYWGNTFQNEFVSVSECPEVFLFANQNPYVNILRSELLLTSPQSYQWTNQYGQVYIGKLYQAVYLVLEWGESFYAFPYDIIGDKPIRDFKNE